MKLSKRQMELNEMVEDAKFLAELDAKMADAKAEHEFYLAMNAEFVDQAQEDRDFEATAEPYELSVMKEEARQLSEAEAWDAEDAAAGSEEEVAPPAKVTAPVASGDDLPF